MTPQALSPTLEDFLTGAADAVVLEDGMVAFDLAQAKYCISGEIHRCLLLLWSAERKVVRRGRSGTRNHLLRLAVLRMGQTRPTKLEICRQRDPRTRTAKRAAAGLPGKAEPAAQGTIRIRVAQENRPC
jgi:hypothetical protein